MIIIISSAEKGSVEAGSLRLAESRYLHLHLHWEKLCFGCCCFSALGLPDVSSCVRSADDIKAKGPDRCDELVEPLN